MTRPIGFILGFIAVFALGQSIHNAGPQPIQPPVVIVQAVNYSDAEMPSGTIDGTNTSFILAHVPKSAACLMLARNGLVQTPGADYTITDSTVTFTTASTPQPGDALVGWYRF